MFRLAYLTFLILFALGFPFVALSCNNYIYYGESGITSSAYFQLNETFTAYADIEKVQIYVSHNKHGQPDQFHYDIALTDGRTLNVNNSGTGCKYIASTTQEIHKYIAFYGSCTAEITPLNDDDIRYIETQLSADRAQAVYEVFGGFD